MSIKRVASLIICLILVLALNVSTALAGDVWTFNYIDGQWGAAMADGDVIEVADNYGDGGLLPVDTDVTYNGMPSIRVNVKEETAWWFAFFMIQPMDISGYQEDGVLQFALKGEKGEEKLGVGFKAPDGGGGDVRAYIEVTADTEWQVVKLPISTILEHQPFLDLTNIDTLILHFTQNSPLKVWIADVRITSESVADAPADTPGDTETPATDTPDVSSPKTGDVNVMIYVILALGSLVTIVALKKRSLAVNK